MRALTCLLFLAAALSASAAEPMTAPAGKRVGVIGLDTSHVIRYAERLNAAPAEERYNGYRIVAAYPIGSADIESAVSRREGYTTEYREKFGVEIADTIEALVGKVDCVILTSNDGRPHLEQAIPVMRAGKPIFIDKPVAGSLADAIMLFDLSEKWNVPMFTASAQRFNPAAEAVRRGETGKLFGANAISPAPLEKTHPDLYWYGIHGVELLYTMMGPGCESVVRIQPRGDDPDNFGSEVVVGRWADGSLGVWRGIRAGRKTYGGHAVTEKELVTLPPYDIPAGYDRTVTEIVTFFESGKSPVDPKESLEIYTFMSAADESKRQGGAEVKLAPVLAQARAEADGKLATISR